MKRSRRRPARKMRADAMHKTLEADHLVKRNRPSARSEPVVPAPLPVVAPDLISGLLDEAILDEAVDGSVQGAGTRAHRAVAELGDTFHQRVAVRFPVEQRQHDVQRGGGQKLRPLRHTRILIYQTSIVKSLATATSASALARSMMPLSW